MINGPQGPFLDRSGVDLRDNGGTLLLRNRTRDGGHLFVGPGHAGLFRDEAVKRRIELFGKHGPYECPVYKYPVRGDGYPIEITKPAEVVPQLLPLMQVGMRAMSLFNGVAGVARNVAAHS